MSTVEVVHIFQRTRISAHWLPAGWLPAGSAGAEDSGTEYSLDCIVLVFVQVNSGRAARSARSVDRLATELACYH
jgi:hypothetical protein